LSPTTAALVGLGTIAIVLVLILLFRGKRRAGDGADAAASGDGSQLLARALPHAARQFLSAAVQSDARVVVVGRRSPPVIALTQAVLGLRQGQTRATQLEGPIEVFEYAGGSSAPVAFMEAADPWAALFALESRYAASKPILAERAVSKAVANGVDLIVWVGITTQGLPLVREIAQPVVSQAAEGERLLVQPIFNWASSARELRPVGVRPRALNRMAEVGIRVPDHLFDYRGVGAR